MSAHLMKKNAFIYTSIQQNTLLVTAQRHDEKQVTAPSTAF